MSMKLGRYRILLSLYASRFDNPRGSITLDTSEANDPYDRLILQTMNPPESTVILVKQFKELLAAGDIEIAPERKFTGILSVMEEYVISASGIAALEALPNFLAQYIQRAPLNLAQMYEDDMKALAAQESNDGKAQAKPISKHVIR